VQGIALFPLEKEKAGPSAPLENASLRMTNLWVLGRKQSAVEVVAFHGCFC
jgi:hypothetical protein